MNRLTEYTKFDVGNKRIKSIGHEKAQIGGLDIRRSIK